MNRSERFCSFILLTLFSVGCQVTPQYNPPEVSVPCEWECEHVQELQQDSIDNYRWWESLNDPMLNALIEKAAAQNLDLQLAMSRVIEARFALKGADANLYPHLDGSVGYSYATFNQRTLNDILGWGCNRGTKQRNVNIFEVGFDAEWELDFFGMYKHQKNALCAMEQSSQEDVSNAWVTLSAEIARSYIELRGLQQRLDILNKEIGAQQDTKDLTNGLMISGFIGTLDEFQVDEELNLLLSQKPQIELFIRKNIHHLSILLGQLPRDLLCELSVSEPLPELPCYTPIGIPSELLRRRPDVRKAERDLAAATEQVGSAIAALFPRISLTGFIGDITTFCSTGSFTGFIGPQLLFPIFNSKLLKEDVYLNKVKVQQALVHYQKTALEALEETENAIATYHYELEKKQTLEKMKASSESAYTLSFQLYQTGLKNYLEVQTAHRSLLASQNALIQNQVDLLTHYISLYKSLGGGWDVFPCEQDSEL